MYFVFLSAIVFLKKTVAEFLRSTAEAIKDGLVELRSMYGNRIYRKRLLICHFCWFTTSLAYYVLGMLLYVVMLWTRRRYTIRSSDNG